jgi:hypothetical protein
VADVEVAGGGGREPAPVGSGGHGQE